jgi:hypothetical protein
VLGHIPHYDATGGNTGYEYESATSDDNAGSKAVE